MKNISLLLHALFVAVSPLLQPVSGSSDVTGKVSGDLRRRRLTYLTWLPFSYLSLISPSFCLF